mmetsp:Transcript_46018/g.147044  ORF Transcript_46018/g.147044 Transcript_46018/m.147044 type:complete len:435 (-) Transcript_46018:172-1476(-)
MEGLERVEEEVPEVLVQVRREDAPVERVAHAPAVHGLADEVLERVPGHGVVPVVEGLGQVRAYERHGDAEVRLVEVVWHVPPELAVLAALLHDGVEESQHVHERAEGLVRAAREALLGDLGIVGPHVEFEPVRGLRHHLERALEDAQGEPVRGVRGHPEAEVLVRLVDLLHDLLQRLEPAREQVAVLQHHPLPARGARLQHLLRLGAHALPERHVLELRPRLEAHLLPQLEEVERRVRARGEHEDHGRHRRRLPEDARVVDHGRHHVLLPHLGNHVVGNTHRHAVHAQAADHAHDVENVEAVLVPQREGLLLRLLQLVPLLPHALVFLDVVGEVVQGEVHVVAVLVLGTLPDLDQAHEVLPALVRKPLERLLPRGLLQGEVALQEEVEKVVVELPVALEHLDGHLEGEHELVLLEQPEAGVVVHVERERVDDVA